MAQLVHNGKLLEDRMIKERRDKKFVCEVLDCSYDTLRARIKDAKFSYDDLKKLKQFNLI